MTVPTSSLPSSATTKVSGSRSGGAITKVLCVRLPPRVLQQGIGQSAVVYPVINTQRGPSSSTAGHGRATGSPPGSRVAPLPATTLSTKSTSSRPSNATAPGDSRRDTSRADARQHRKAGKHEKKSDSDTDPVTAGGSCGSDLRASGHHPAYGTATVPKAGRCLRAATYSTDERSPHRTRNSSTVSSPSWSFT